MKFNFQKHAFSLCSSPHFGPATVFRDHILYSFHSASTQLLEFIFSLAQATADELQICCVMMSACRFDCVSL